MGSTSSVDPATGSAAAVEEDEAGLPYWQVNIPPHERETECPDFLRELSDKDRGIIRTPQEDYRIMAWPDVRALVAANRLDRFQRDPLALRRYLAYAWSLRKTHGGAVNFVLRERLRWSPEELPSPAPPFSRPSDVKILCNDWPYGIDPRIVHLVVWTKFSLDEDPATGDLTAGARAAVERFVRDTFGALPPESYIWFKNWRSLKSVLLVEHFHVMLYDPPAGFVDKITGGDVPLSERLARGGGIMD